MRDEGSSEKPNTGARVAAGVALALAVAVVVAVFLRGSGDYTVRARFASASNIVKGNPVKYGGRPVGSVTGIKITDDGEAELELRIDSDMAPLREGTRANLRMASLSGVANRYVDLDLPPGKPEEIPDGGLIRSTDTTTQVDIDQLFNTFDAPTRRGLRDVLRGQAAAFGGRATEANLGLLYLNPSLVAADRLFREVNADTPALEGFVVETARLMTEVGERRDDLASLVDDLATALGAIARQDEALATSIGALPGFLRRANTTFVNLRATLDDLDPLVAESMPVARLLTPFLRDLRGFAEGARPTVRDLSAIVRSPGASNDLLELSRSIPPLRDITIGPVRANGAERPGSFAASTRSLRGQTPIFQFQRPYAVDLTGWFDDFSHSGVYDANGSMSRNATSVSAFREVNGALEPVPPELRRSIFNSIVRLHQNNRCPGSMERAGGGNPWRPSPDYDCDPTQVPPGR